MTIILQIFAVSKADGASFHSDHQMATEIWSKVGHENKKNKKKNTQMLCFWGMLFLNPRQLLFLPEGAETWMCGLLLILQALLDRRDRWGGVTPPDITSPSTCPLQYTSSSITFFGIQARLLSPKRQHAFCGLVTVLYSCRSEVDVIGWDPLMLEVILLKYKIITSERFYSQFNHFQHKWAVST